MGMTLATTIISVVVILWALVPAIRSARRPDWSTSSIVCEMSVLIAVGTLVFSIRRIALLVSGSPLILSQPAWSTVGVVFGCGCTTAALCLSLVWRARRVVPGSENKVAALLAAFIGLSLVGGMIAL